jgi:hypothetical protein
MVPVRNHSLREPSGTALPPNEAVVDAQRHLWSERNNEHEMTKHTVRLPNSDESLLLRELNHRIKNELTSAIYTVSAKAMHSNNVAVKAALLDVVDLLHQMRRCSSRAAHAGPGASHRCREVPPAALPLHNEVSTEPPGDTLLVFNR